MVVDMRVRVPPGEIWGGRPPEPAEVPPFLHRYLALYDPLKTAHLTGADLLEQMDGAGVDWAVVQAEFEFGDYRLLNAAVARLVQAFPDRLRGMITVDPASGDDPVDVIRAARSWGAVGVNLQPWAYRRHAHDPWFHPLYEYCQAEGLGVTLHTSVNFSTDRSIDFGRPLYLDMVACDFPRLRLVANHGGWPWVHELVAVAWKHPHVYIELGGIAPKYFATPGAGWEPLLHYGANLLRDKLLWATDWPLLPFGRSLAEFSRLPWPEEVKQAALGGNAARLIAPPGPRT